MLLFVSHMCSLELWSNLSKKLRSVSLCIPIPVVQKGNQHGDREYDDL